MNTSDSLNLYFEDLRRNDNAYKKMDFTIPSRISLAGHYFCQCSIL